MPGPPRESPRARESLMTEIHLYNTRTRRKEPFAPIDPGNVRMYVCGPTVYDRAHIGNARPVVVFDVLYRLLRHVYGEKAVTYVRNFTDVDDKINARAAETGRSIREITDETIGWFREDMKALGELPPTKEPRATEYIPEMIAMIEALIPKHAYPAEGHVLFDVASYADYGKLSRRSLDDMVAGARVEVAPYKRDPMDFVLWKPSSDDLPGWDSPWGRGRPGWHIECSAMAKALLGETFDIHGGGIDLAFPHHENEVAQSCCANHTEVMAKVWMHNGFLQVEGEKMAKSAGNFFTVKDLLDEGVPGEVIRFALLSTHYRQPLDWTKDRVEEATATLRKWRALTDGVAPAAEMPAGVLAALADDLNTSKVMAELHALAGQGDASKLVIGANLIGLLTPELSNWNWQQPTKRVVFRAINSLTSPLDGVVDPTQGISKALRPLKGLEKALRPLQEIEKILKPFKDVEKILRPHDGFEKLLQSQTGIEKALRPLASLESLWGSQLGLAKILQNSRLAQLDEMFAKLGEPLRSFAKRIKEFESEYDDLLATADGEVPLDPKVFKRARDLRINDLIANRSTARKDRDYSTADALRKEADAAGFILIDTKNGTFWGIKE